MPNGDVHGAPPEPTPASEPARPARSRTRCHVAIVVGLALLLLLLWIAPEVPLLAFAGILLGVLLRACADGVTHHLGLPPGWSLALVLIGGAAVVGGATWLLAPRVAGEFRELRESLPAAVAKLEQRLESWEPTRTLLSEVRNGGFAWPARTPLVARWTGIVSGTVGVLMDVLIVLFVGICLAIEPRLYLRGLLRLVPKPRRPRADAVLSETGRTLRWWLLAKGVSMVAIAILTFAGLWLLGVPLALVLALLAGLLAFIPNVGPIFAAVPAVLLAFAESPMSALYVVLLYLGVQILESNFITPFVERRTVSLPPALTILVQLLMGVTFGVLGLMLAPSLTAAGIVLVRMLYVEDVLQDRPAGTTDRVDLRSR